MSDLLDTTRHGEDLWLQWWQCPSQLESTWNFAKIEVRKRCIYKDMASKRDKSWLKALWELRSMYNYIRQLGCPWSAPQSNRVNAEFFSDDLYSLAINLWKKGNTNPRTTNEDHMAPPPSNLHPKTPIPINTPLVPILWLFLWHTVAGANAMTISRPSSAGTSPPINSSLSGNAKDEAFLVSDEIRF